MRDLDEVQHHPLMEEIVQLLCKKTQNESPLFFRVQTAYFLGTMAASMRASLDTLDRGNVPINIYALNVAPSGFGKGHSTNIIEGSMLHKFRERFMSDTFPIMAEHNLWEIARQRAMRNQTDENNEFEGLVKEFKTSGGALFAFDSATGPAIKQMRGKLLLAGAGALNFQVDEIGSNLINNLEALNVFLELYDQGLVKQKLVKNTAENVRGEELEGKTPANMLLFGTPAKLLNGGKEEDEFYSLLETGYARRCLFGMSTRERAAHKLTPEQIFANLKDKSNNKLLERLANHFELLADPSKFGQRIPMPEAVSVELIRYKSDCEARADEMPDHQEIHKAELSHRYFKAMKLAGAYAFVDESPTVTMDHLWAAIKLVEESGASLMGILNREKNYVKLAKFIASAGTELTHADMMDSLPFFKGSAGAKSEMLTLATAWGYKNHIVLKKSFTDGIEFYSGEALKETNLNELLLSWSNHEAYRYTTETAVPFDQLDTLMKLKDHHWITHALPRGNASEGHRTEENCLPGFNLLVLDVDGKGVTLDMARELLKDYTYALYTTKRHQLNGEGDRFRVIIPTNYVIKLNGPEYKEFMDNVYSWLPFPVDDSTGQRSRKWLTNANGHYEVNHGQLMDVLPFIPRTSKNEEFRQNVMRMDSLDNLERWFAQRMVTGSRNNLMHRFARILVDAGMSFNEVQEKVVSFNKKLSNKLPEDELHATVLVTVGKEMAARQAGQP